MSGWAGRSSSGSPRAPPYNLHYFRCRSICTGVPFGRAQITTMTLNLIPTMTWVAQMATMTLSNHNVYIRPIRVAIGIRALILNKCSHQWKLGLFSCHPHTIQYESPYNINASQQIHDLTAAMAAISFILCCYLLQTGSCVGAWTGIFLLLKIPPEIGDTQRRPTRRPT